MTKIKFFHVLTGKRVSVAFAQGIMTFRNERGVTEKRCVDRNTVMKYMWSQGYCRCGRNTILSDIEKELIKQAPAMIQEARDKGIQL